MPKFKPVFTIRVIYKSGYNHDFDVFSFSLEGGIYKWVSADVNNRPIDLGGSEIAAVFQLGQRNRLYWS